MTERFRNLRDEICGSELEKQKEAYTNSLESFDVYAARMKEKMHTSTELYLQHLQQGYNAILNKIASKLTQSS